MIYILMLNRNYIRRNITSISILMFISSFMIIQFFKPGCLYNRDGSLRQFGLNSSKRTVIPIWLLSFILAIMSYLIVLYYLAIPKLL